MNVLDRVITISEATEILGYKKETSIRNDIHSGKYPSNKYSKRKGVYLLDKNFILELKKKRDKNK